MKNKKEKYIAPTLEISKIDVADMISTSGFLGEDHVLKGTEIDAYNLGGI